MPQISAIVPARNEEMNIEACITSLAAQPEITEIIAVNDQSTDHTPQILARLSKTIRSLKVLQTDTPPSGWLGKNYAAWCGGQAAHCDWLLFADADTILLPGAARRALTDARDDDAALVSYSPEQITQTFAERALIPFVYCRLARRFDFARVNNPSLPDAAANGQFLLIHRGAYEKVGGHLSVANSVLEDVALARRIKQAGFRLYFASGHHIVRTRMYRSFPALWEGWTKNLYLLLGGTGRDTLREFLVVVPWLAMVLIVAGGILRGEVGRLFFAGGLADLLLRHALYGHQLISNRYSLRPIIYYVAGVALYAVAIATSARKFRRGKVVWKGREYPVREP